ncbi:MAG: pseudouridine synthase [Bacteroidetes bacterium]|nr:pseudouridine synthase [Bacteroidota bacterium]
MFSYFVIYKPYGMLSQFTPEGNKPALGSLFDFPKGCYPVGRLDSDSEGLLILTNDKKLNYELLDPGKKHLREYYVQVDGAITDEAIEKLCHGVQVKSEGKKYTTLPAKAKRIDDPSLPPRVPPVRFRKNIPTSWISLTLLEGKNRQVRHMTAAAGFPTLRLVRVHIEKLSLGKMQPGEVMEYKAEKIYSLLQLRTKIV